MFDDGTVAVVQGIGYPNSSRSHFRAMDIWHTCEPIEVGTEGWLGRATRELDPNGENVLTAVNFGRGLPRALAVPGVPITSVGDLENYGLMTGIDDVDQRDEKRPLRLGNTRPQTDDRSESPGLVQREQPRAYELRGQFA
jgi:hypothetical protein